MSASPGRVLILDENLPVPFDRRVWSEATALAEAGYHISVICPRGAYPRWFERQDGISIYRCPIPSLPGLAGHLVEYGLALPMFFFMTLVVWAWEGFDVIQSTNPPDVFFLIGRFFKLFGKKFVFDHHDLVPESCLTRWSGFKLSIMYRLTSWAERATFRAADLVISTNESYREVAIRRGKLSPERVVVVRSGPRADRFTAVAPRAELKSGRRYLVVYLGVMGPNDGVGHLLEAIETIVKTRRRTDIQFALIGGGDLQPSMSRRSRELGLEEFVHFTGRIPDAEVMAYLSTADLAAAPDPKDALNDLSTMNKIMEYMALGKPIVSFDLHESRVSADGAAVFVEGNDPAAFGQAVIDLLDAPAMRQQMSEAGQERFRRDLAWEHQRERLLHAYDELLHRQRVRSGLSA